MSATVSIIMGIYNCATTLPQAIESLLNQSYTDWELIMCDDGSTDQTYLVAKDYQAKYPERIKLLRNEKNQGLNYTLNRCLCEANGEYIARQDGDDMSLPLRLEKEISFLQAHPEYAIVSTALIHFDEKGDWAISKPIAEPTKTDVLKRFPFAHAACMVTKDAINHVGGYSVSPKLLRVEDYHLWYKLYLAGYRGVNFEEPLYKCRDDRDAVSRRKLTYRLNECYVKWLIFRDFHLPLSNIVYVVRPLLVGLLPRFLYTLLHRIRVGRQ